MTGLELSQRDSEFINNITGVGNRFGIAEQIFKMIQLGTDKVSWRMRQVDTFQDLENAYNEAQYSIICGTITVEQLNMFCRMVADFKMKHLNPTFQQERHVLDTASYQNKNLSDVSL